MKKTILVTDSGLGGLSVFADIADCLATDSPWQDVSMIYFNAWPEQQRGYNNFPDMAQRAGVFHNAMHAMAEFQPDMILIACNTLSVIYPHTEFSKSADIFVTGIVDHGVEMIFEALTNEPDSGVIIFGTPTTIEARSHAHALTARGISPDRIINQGCTDLAGKIERNPFSDTVATMIDENAMEASLKIKEKQAKGGPAFKKVFAALCCTHFGYRRELFVKAVQQHITENVAILNPNARMARQIVSTETGSTMPLTPGKKSQETGGVRKSFQAEIHMHIVSKIEWEKTRMDAYTRLFQERYPATVEVLKGYELNPDLF